MASAAIRAQTQKLGIGGATVDASSLQTLIAALEKGTRVFAGAARTKQVFEGLATRLMEELQP